MDELTDSDITMAATTSFNNILNQIQTSGLNYQLKITPFSAVISIKKSFVKDREGVPIWSVEKMLDMGAKNDIKVKQELDELKQKQKEYSRGLDTAFNIMEELKNSVATSKWNIIS